MNEIEALRTRARDLVREHYESAREFTKQPLGELNRHVGAELKYRSYREVLRDHVGRANAVASFAVHLGLLEPDEMLTLAKALLLDINEADSQAHSSHD